MRKLITIVLLIIHCGVYGQYATNKIVYKMNVDEVSLKTSAGLSQAEKGANTVLSGMASTIINLESILLFNDQEASYFVAPSVVPDESTMMPLERISYMMAFNKMGGGLNDFYYLNTKTETKEKVVERGGEIFRIVSLGERPNWSINYEEKKEILGYRCFHATTSKKEYDYRRKKELVLYYSVWFTPEIKYSFGPKGYDGLPGLVLGVDVGKMFLSAVEIIELSNKDKEKIKRPKKGQKLTQDKLNQLMNDIEK